MIRADVDITADEGPTLHLRLGDQHLVERITIDDRQRFNVEGVFSRDRQAAKRLPLEHQIEFSGNGQFPQDPFDGDCPDRHSADVDPIQRVSNCSTGRGGQRPIIIPPPQENLCIE